ncbi:MAG: hypothetical protein ACYC4D_08400 [Thermoleophilia bacterium]
MFSSFLRSGASGPEGVHLSQADRQRSLAGIFIYRAASGSAILQKFERPIHAFIGFLIVIQNLVFNYSLISNTTFRFEYENAKGGMEMDYSRLAYEHMHVSLVTVAKFILAMTVITPFISLGINLALRIRRQQSGSDVGYRR